MANPKALIRVADRYTFMARLRDSHPDPKSDLNWSTPFELLVAVVLSAQATDKGVNLATDKLFPVANTPDAILKLGEAGLIEYIKTIGLYQSKARHIIGLCQLIMEKHAGHVPATFDDLIALPGVGRKTANVVLNVAFGEPRIAVDTHIFRVCNRTGFAKGKTPDAVEDRLYEVVPDEFLRHAHHYILLHGRYCCKARNPSCRICPVLDLCFAPERLERVPLSEQKSE